MQREKSSKSKKTETRELTAFIWQYNHQEEKLQCI